MINTTFLGYFYAKHKVLRTSSVLLPFFYCFFPFILFCTQYYIVLCCARYFSTFCVMTFFDWTHRHLPSKCFETNQTKYNLKPQSQLFCGIQRKRPEQCFCTGTSSLKIANFSPTRFFFSFFRVEQNF